MRETAGAGSVNGSLAALSRQSWWQRFREGRRDVPLVDDLLFVGHFCLWLQAQRLAVHEVTLAHLDAYRTSLASFRAGPREAHERAAKALVRFFSPRP